MDIQEHELSSPLIDVNTYPLIAKEASQLRTTIPEVIAPRDRRKKIADLFNELLYSHTPFDNVASRIASQMENLIKTDPLTDQQVGIVTRAQRTLGRVAPFKSLDPKLAFSLEESLTIQSGDWKEIEYLFSRSDEKKKVWKQNQAEAIFTPKPKTVFRALHLGPGDIEAIRTYGLIPEGLRRYGSLSEIIQQRTAGLWGKGEQFKSDEAELRHILEMLFISKINILHNVYESGEFWMSSPFKLGMSFTTPENLKKHARFFAPYIVEAKIRGNWLIAARKGAGAGDEDEQTVLFYVPPEDIIGIFEVNSNSPENLIDQIQKLKQHATSPNHYWKRLIKR